MSDNDKEKYIYVKGKKYMYLMKCIEHIKKRLIMKLI